ncbi:hypothetical protein [Corallococcus exiguus]|uniref:hypothetical protein n=1 Tax=Corallococcus exiguus TaxID=83462 RepID=UPI0014945306|nr:hypothetical protein [Corallococcus exiguus]NPD22730.1 hypothetical protein [Corallococcus exiguus]
MVRDIPDSKRRAWRIPVYNQRTLLPAQADSRRGHFTRRRHMNRVELKKGMEGWMSENGNYFIPDDWGGQVIFATAAPLNSVVFRKQGLNDTLFSSKTYVPYVSTTFIKDCLHTAEEIMHQSLFDPKEGATRSKSVENGSAFGNSKLENVLVAQSLLKGRGSNDNAAPLAGQAYVIVNMKWDTEGTSPYHAAGVVAVDGGDRITLEVFASTRTSYARKEAGCYRMYKTSGVDGHTFHGAWGSQEEYFSDSAVTFALCTK